MFSSRDYTNSAKSGDDVDVRNVLFGFLPVANNLLDVERVHVFRPPALRVVNTFRFEFRRPRVHLRQLGLVTQYSIYTDIEY